MRFVPTPCLSPGMIVGKDLYWQNSELLLAEGNVLSEVQIIRLKILKFQGIYINDEISGDIEVRDMIDSEIRNRLVRSLKEIFVKTENGEFAQNNLVNLKRMVDDIISEISTDTDIIYNMMDLKFFDDYTYYHCINVFILSLIVGLALKLCRDELFSLGMAAILHDIGKIFVPKKIINKKGRLTDDEFEVIKAHTENGCRYLKEKWEVSDESALAVLTHHEKNNGTGYPYRLKADKIPLYGKIIAVSDVYDALISDRPYRKAFLPSEAMEYVLGCSGRCFDPEIVETFFRRVMPFPVGTTVQLSNGMTGVVIENHPENCLRPKVRIISEDKGGTDCYDLLNDKDLLNVTIVDSFTT